MKAYEILKGMLTVNQKRFIKRTLRIGPRPIPDAQNLRLMAQKYGTDKLQHGYTEYYQTYFSSRRLEKLKILEIGVYKGASVRMWAEFFPNSSIYAIDILDKSEYATDRIRIFQGNQNDPVFLHSVAEKTGLLDIIIDDGSHINEHVFTSFQTLFPHLKARGTYVIEDLQTAYDKSYGGNPDDLDDPSTSVAMLKRMIDGLNHPHIKNRQPSLLDQSITTIHFYPNIAFIFTGRKYVSAGLPAADATVAGK